MRRSIIILDDFHENPEEVRNYAISATYSKEESSTYPGLNSTTGFQEDTLKLKIETLLQKPIKPSNPFGYFRYSWNTADQENEKLQKYHVDNGWEWGGVCYLSTPEQLKDNPDSGTLFARHKALKIDATPRTAEEAELFGYTHYDELRQSIIYGDGLDENKWETYARVLPKFNRLILFRSWMYHSHHINFGPQDPAQSRLVQLFFFNT
mgnify:FL=1|jgi:hypothetical protein